VRSINALGRLAVRGGEIRHLVPDIVYSVHDDDAVKRETKRIRCTYLMKGRPRQFKEELKQVLSYDPLSEL